MSSEILLCAMFLLLLVECAIILWTNFDHVKKRRRPHKKEIFICADCWLLVFDFVAPSQLGLGIALISRRFDFYVDEHFKTRKWALTNKILIIQWHIKKNGTKKMQIVKSDGLRLVDSDDGIFPAFPPVESANATDGETVAKWLFTPLPDGGPKWLKCLVNSSLDQWTTNMEQLRTAFSNASSPVTFFIVLKLSSTLSGSVMPFFLINEVTGEQLALEQYDLDAFELLRCPIGWVWENWKSVWKELSAARPRRIDIWIRDGGFDEGLLEAASPGPSDQQQQQ